MVSSLALGIRSGFRLIKRRPGFSLALILAAALGLAANSAAFTLIDAVFLRAAPYSGIEQLVYLEVPREKLLHLMAKDRLRLVGILPALDGSGLMESSVFVHGAPSGADGSWASEATGVAPLRVVDSSHGLLTLLRIVPVLGRDLIPEDARTSPPGAIITEAIWRERFGGDPSIVGRPVRLPVLRGEVAATIVGIAPATLKFPAGTDVWRALQRPSVITTGGLVGRLRADAALQTLQAVVPDVSVTPLLNRVRPGQSILLTYFVSASIGLFLMAWLQVGALVLSRYIGRLPEIGVRVALGATATRLRIEWLGEVLALLGLATILALVLASALTAVVGGWLPGLLKVSQDISFGLRGTGVLLFLACAGTIAVSLVPASLLSTVSSRAGRYELKTGRTRWRDAIAIAQIAVVTAGLYATTLVVRSYSAVTSVDVGFDPAGIWTLSLPSYDLPPKASPETMRAAALAQRARVLDLLQRLRSMQTVEAVSLEGWPLQPGSLDVNLVRASGDPPEGFTPAKVARVGPEFLNVLAVPLHNAADWLPGVKEQAQRRAQQALVHKPYTEVESEPGMVLVSASYARYLERYGPPIGQAIHLVNGGIQRIVGIIPEIKFESPSEPLIPTIWTFTDGTVGRGILVRPSAANSAIPESVREVVADVWKGRSIGRMVPVQRWYEAATAEYRATTMILVSLVIVSLPATCLGIIGWMAHWHQEHRFECALRLAFGATNLSVSALLVRRLTALAAIGLAVGGCLGVAGGKGIASKLFGVSPLEPWAITIVIATTGALIVGCLGMAVARIARLDVLSVVKEV